MEKFTREITFEGINNEIKETLEELGYTNIEYLEDFCSENNLELIVKTQMRVVEYNTQVFKNLYIANNLCVDTIELLYNNYVFLCYGK